LLFAIEAGDLLDLVKMMQSDMIWNIIKSTRIKVKKYE
jgi:hypothetical protein